MSTTPATPGPYSGTSLPATTPAARPPGLAEAFTDEQLQAAIDAAFPAGQRSEGFNLETVGYKAPSFWANEAPNRLAIARAFLDALPNEGASATSDPYARLKAYAKAGARIRCGNGKWEVDEAWVWFFEPGRYRIHPDDLHMCPEYAPAKPADGGPCPLRDEEQAKPTQEDLLAEAMKHPGVPDVEKVYGQQAKPAEKPCGFNSALDVPHLPDDGPEWTLHDGGPCPLKDEEVEEWEYEMRCGIKGKLEIQPTNLRAYWRDNNHPHDFIAYRVLRWKPGHGPQEAQYYMPKLPNPLAKPDQAPAAPTEEVEAIKRQRDSLLASLEADKKWIMKAHSMLDDRRWAGKSEMEALVTELEEAWAEIHELAMPAQAPAAPSEAAEAQQDRIRMTVNEGLNKRCHELNDMLRHAEAKLAELQASQPPAQPWTPQPGDVVRLKSGGPSMTVTGVFNCPKAGWYAALAWFADGRSFGTFNATFSALQPAKEEAQP